MKVALIARSSLFKSFGGDSVQIINLSKQLRRLGVDTDIRLFSEDIHYAQYHLLHFFNIGSAPPIFRHLRLFKKTGAKMPVILTPNLVDYSEFDKKHRTGLSGLLFRILSGKQIEHVKMIARHITGTDPVNALPVLVKPYADAVKYVLENVSLILPNSRMEYSRIEKQYNNRFAHTVIRNGIDTEIFHYDQYPQKSATMVLSIARIEGLKNQLNLIRAMNGTGFQLFIIGRPSLNQSRYYDLCKRLAGPNITFIDHIPQYELVKYYAQAKVHVLPSWFETCGLSSLEAAAMGCNIVITDKGYAREYFGDHGFYCDPGSPESIRNAIEKASEAEFSEELKCDIHRQYTWKTSARETLSAYRKLLNPA
jgi:glycosyltransferase involved in cell wall biosynthesis